MKYLLSFVVLFSIGVSLIDAHGMMLSPPSRSTRWRYDSSAPPNYTDNQLFCGGLDVMTANGGRCGLCGDNFSDPQPRANEIGGEFGGWGGVITSSYTAQSYISVRIKITQNHLGHFEFHLCNLDAYGYESEDCFNNKRLRFADGTDSLYIGTQSGEFDVTIKLPDSVTCNHCVLRWTYIGGNNWNWCDDGHGELGCGPQETFKNCADVRINWGRNMIEELAQSAQPLEVVDMPVEAIVIPVKESVEKVEDIHMSVETIIKPVKESVEKVEEALHAVEEALEVLKVVAPDV